MNRGHSLAVLSHPADLLRTLICLDRGLQLFSVYSYSCLFTGHPQGPPSLITTLIWSHITLETPKQKARPGAHTSCQTLVLVFRVGQVLNSGHLR